MWKLSVVPRNKPPEQIEEGWDGFPERLRFAVRTRLKQRKSSVRQLAIAARYDESNLGKMLADQPTRWEGLTVNSLLSFARVLQVSPLWLMIGQEPSGLAEHRDDTPIPPSNVRESQPAIKTK